jgi:Ser/Thr protein kinase RdoA (MazF antagonist)
MQAEIHHTPDAPDAIDPLAILTHLGVEDAGAVTRVHGGWDTAIWRVERPGGVSALRLFRAQQRAVCEREVAAMRAAAAAGIPVPEVQAQGTWHERPVLLLSWCPGRPLAQELESRPWRAWHLGRAFGRLQARLRTVPAPATLRRERWEWIEWAGPLDGPLKGRLIELAGAAEVLLHLDYHPLNVLTDGAQITAVLDWANARTGDARADVARTYTILRVMPLPRTATSAAVALVRRLLARGWQHGYREVAGDLPAMAAFYAWAGEVMVRDLTPKLGTPGIWLQPSHLAAIQRWTATWRRRAGLP